MNHDIFAIALQIGANAASTHVGMGAEDRVPNIVVMRNLNVVEQDAVFQLAGVADHAALTNDDVATEIGARTELSPTADDRRRFNGRGLRDLDVLANEDARFNLGIAFKATGNLFLNDLFDLWEDLPWISGVLERLLQEWNGAFFVEFFGFDVELIHRRTPSS